MYDLKGIYLPLTKENILERVSEYEIFSYFLEYEPVLGKLYHSPFREDRNPSFNVFVNRNGKLMYKDFNHSYGDCFFFVMQLKNMSFFEALMLIDNNIAGLRLGKSKKKVNENVYIQSKSRIYCSFIRFTKSDLDYWAKFGIGKKTLERFNVKSCAQVFINGFLLAKREANNPIYCYCFPSGNKKVYLPLTRNKIKKFRTNCNGYDLQGLSQLTFHQHTLLLTKSMKDVMTLYELGYEAVAPHGESHALPLGIVSYLKEHFEEITVFFDNDAAGIEGRKKIASSDWSYIQIPLKYGVKDISDFYLLYGKQASKRLLKELYESRKLV